jgi:hypothetical protein
MNESPLLNLTAACDSLPSTSPNPALGAAPCVRARFRRWLSPAAFLLALVLFPLPWMEVQCSTNGAKGTKSPGGNPAPAPLSAMEDVQEWLLDHLGLPSSRWEALFSQSGIETALGTYSIRVSGGAKPEVDKRLSDNVHASMVVAVLPIVLTLGFLSSLRSRRSAWCRRLMTLLAFTALTLLVFQIISGFPLQQGILAIEREDAVRNHKSVDSVTAASPEPGMRFHYTCWFGLVLGALTGVAIVESLDTFIAHRKRRRRGSTVP